jgi:hypothetical protein
MTVLVGQCVLDTNFPIQMVCAFYRNLRFLRRAGVRRLNNFFCVLCG